MPDADSSYHREDDGYDARTTAPWWKTQKAAWAAAAVLALILVSKKMSGGGGDSGYSFAEECVQNMMRGVSMECGAAIFGYDCDGTLDCQVAHNNIYCAKCGCDNELIGELFEDLPEECESYFSDE